MSFRNLRISSTIHKAIADILIEKCFDFIGAINVSNVILSSDMKHASVYIVFSHEFSDNAKEILKELNEISPTIQYLLSKRVTLKYVPKLRFKLDENFYNNLKIEDLLKY